LRGPDAQRRAADGDLIEPSAALLRFAGLILAALPLFAGFLTILVGRPPPRGSRHARGHRRRAGSS
jgi:hypothetical protein